MSIAYRKLPSNFFSPSEGFFDLGEDFGTYDDMPEFAILSPDGTQVGTWMKCKDFIQDTIWGNKHRRYYEVYGWEFDPTKDKISNRYLLLAMRWKTKTIKELREMLSNVKGTIENLESALSIPKFRRTKFSRVLAGPAGGTHFIVYGSPDWMKCVSTVSFFSWLLRASLTNKARTFEAMNDLKKCAVNKDIYYLRGGKSFIEKLVKDGFKAFESDWDVDDVMKVHHNGFVKSAVEMDKKSGKQTYCPGGDEEWDF